MALTRKEKLAALAKRRDSFMDTVFEAKMKLANEVKVYGEFSSFVKVIDDDEALMLETSFEHEQQVTQAVREKPIATKADDSDLLQDFEEAFSTFDAEEGEANDKGSDYWDKRYQ